MVSPNNYFVFTPLLASTSVGTLEFRSAIEPVRNEGIKFTESRCTSIDYRNKFITCHSENDCGENDGDGFTVSYDKLILACGMVPNTFGIAGVAKHASFLKDISDARAIRSKLLHSFELASHPTVSEEEKQRLLHFVVIGAGPTGTEFTAELFDFVNDDVTKRYPHLRKDIRITLYDASSKILPSFNDSLSAYAMDKFVRRGINVKTDTVVSSVDKTQVTLKDGSVVPYGLLVWSAGLAPNDLVRAAHSLPKDRMQRLYTNSQMQVIDGQGEAISGFYAVGDCAAVKGYELPPTAQVARQKAEFLAKMLNCGGSATGGEFRYKHKGSMAYLGDRSAVVDLGSGKSSTGTLGWIIWRTAYMSMAESLRNKIKIPTYWILTSILGRETSRF